MATRASVEQSFVTPVEHASKKGVVDGMVNDAFQTPKDVLQARIAKKKACVDSALFGAACPPRRAVQSAEPASNGATARLATMVA